MGRREDVVRLQTLLQGKKELRVSKRVKNKIRQIFGQTREGIETDPLSEELGNALRRVMYGNLEIAQALGKSRDTIENQLCLSIAGLGVSDRTSALVVAMEGGEIETIPFPALQKAKEVIKASKRRYPLTEHREEILKHVAQGSPNKEIALMLGISKQTVANDLTAIFRKLRVENRTQAVLVWLWMNKRSP